MQEINEYVKSHSSRVKEFLNSKTVGHIPPIFTSVDIRTSAFKITPVDTNLFPAGFNNLTPYGISILADKLKTYMHRYFPDVSKVRIFPEEFTRNTNYLESLKALVKQFQLLGLDTRTVGDWDPDLIVLNNDLTNGVPEELQNSKTHIIPNINLGWYRRRKHRHFEVYNQIITEFCGMGNFDPWLLSTEFESCDGIDFRNKIGLLSIAQKVDDVLARVREKYQQYSIKEQPLAFVKADQGTYGIGIMVVRSGQDVLDINKKKRHSMQYIKQGLKNSNIVIQEGVPTVETYQGAVSESMLYLCGAEPIEILCRFHERRAPYESLNAPGMEFSTQLDELHTLKNLLAQVAVLATGYE